MDSHLASPLIDWTAWDAPERIAVHSAIRDGLGRDLPRLLFISYANGALKVSATRQPLRHLTEATRIPRIMHTRIDGVLASESDRTAGRITQTLVKRLQLKAISVFNALAEGRIREAAKLAGTSSKALPDPVMMRAAMAAKDRVWEIATEARDNILLIIGADLADRIEPAINAYRNKIEQRLFASLRNPRLG